MASQVNLETSTSPKSALERFLDNFLHETSIKWMLVIGAAIVTSSSLMLVTRQWTSWPVTLKYLTILSYTAATYGNAEYCGRRLKLEATSRGHDHRRSDLDGSIDLSARNLTESDTRQ